MGFQSLDLASAAATTSNTTASIGRERQLPAGLEGQGFEAQSAALSPRGAEEKKDTTVMQDIALSQNPNDRERAIMENDADAASAWVRAASFAIGISQTYSLTRPSAEKSSYLGKADALRHCLWNAYMAYMLGERRAEALANAHELPGELKGNSAVDRDMDLFNNRVGRMLGVTARDTAWMAPPIALPFIAAAAMEWLNSGGLRVVDQTDPQNHKLVLSSRPDID